MEDKIIVAQQYAHSLATIGTTIESMCATLAVDQPINSIVAIADVYMESLRSLTALTQGALDALIANGSI